MSNVNFADLAIWFPAFLLSITFHEAAHAWTSLSYGDRTAERQASLNPIPHIQQEPIGTLVFPFITFFLWGWTLGWASAPYDPRWANRHPRRAGLMSLAGPLANLVLAGVSLGVIWILVVTEVVYIHPALTLGGMPPLSELVLTGDEGLVFVAKFLSVTYALNLILAFFNLIPVPPLDGAGVIQGFFAGSAPARFLADIEERGWSFIGLIAAWLLFSRVVIYGVVWIARAGLGQM